MLRLFKQYYPIRNAIFVLGEGLFIFLSVIIACWLLIGGVSLRVQSWLIVKVLLITIICQICLYYNDLYDLKITDTFSELGIRLMQALGASAILLSLIYFLFPDAIIREGIFIVSIGIVILFIVSWRFGYAHILSIGLFDRRIFVIGSSDTAKVIVNQIQDKKDIGYKIEAIISKKKWEQFIIGKNIELYWQDNYDNISELALQKGIDEIIVALEEKRGSFPTKELLKCRVNGIDVIEGNSFYEMLTGKLIVEEINPSWLIFSKGFQKSTIKKIIKRVVDLIIALTMLIVLSPLILAIGILIKLDSKGPAIFSQERVGQGDKIYKVHKFRSMYSDAEKNTGPVWAKDNDERITRLGHFIRKTRIDEIPQLWNVLIGEMSFVGPRPEREHFVSKLKELIPYYNERFTVKPGITGWAQVSYGYGASIKDATEKLNYDLFYIKNMSTFFDLMIIARTIKTVLFGKGR